MRLRRQACLASLPWRTLALLKTCLIAAWLVSAHAASGLDPDPGLLIHAENAGSDVREQSVTVLRQTRDGYLWLGTSLGLVRFDGVTFTNFAREGTPGATFDPIAPESLWEDPQGVLWAGTYNRGVIRVDHGQFTRLDTDSGLADNEVERVDGDETGATWIFGERGITRIANGRFEKIDPFQQNAGGTTRLKADSRRASDVRHIGRWRETPGGIERFAFGHWQLFPLPAGRAAIFYKDVRNIYEDSLGRVWYALHSEPGRYFCVQGGQLRTYTGVPPKAFVTYEDSEGYLWLTDHAGNAARWKDGVSTPLAPFRSPFFLHVVERKDASFWLTAHHSALYLLRRPVVTTIPTPGNPEVGAVLYRAKDGTVWAGGVGIDRLGAGGRLEPFPVFPPFADLNYINALSEDTEGHLLYNTRLNSHLFRMKGNLRSDALPYPSVTGTVYHMLLDHLGQQWLATKAGLLVVKHAPAGDTVRTLVDLRVNCLSETSPGHLWVGTEQGLLNVENGTLQQLPSSARWSYGSILSIAGDLSGDLWLGTRADGLVLYRNGQFHGFGVKDGLPTDMIGTVQTGDPSALWLKTDVGLVRVERSSLERRLADPNFKLSVSRFGVDDGLLSNTMYPFGNEGSLRLDDGTLWFSTIAGIVVVHPQQMPHPASMPHTLVEEHVIDQSGLRSGAPVVMQPGQDSLELHYTALGSEDPAELKFRYQLEQIDSGWVQAGDRRVAYYTHLPPGTYQFRVQAANADGDAWDTPGATISVRVLSSWYRTRWFAALVIFAVLLLLLALLRRRQLRELANRQLRQAFTHRLLASQETERKRIAHDLHDSLGQHLALITNLAQLHQRDDLPATARDGLGRIQEEADVAIGEVESISYNLRPYQLDRLGLTNAVLSLVRGIKEATPLEVACEVANIDGIFDKDLEINFYRIVQESLSNIARHSKATSAEVRVACNDGHVQLVIRDNGVGFSSALTPAGDTLGLVGINERAELLGGSATIESGQGRGTTIIVSLARNGTRSR